MLGSSAPGKDVEQESSIRSITTRKYLETNYYKTTKAQFFYQLWMQRNINDLNAGQGRAPAWVNRDHRKLHGEAEEKPDTGDTISLEEKAASGVVGSAGAGWTDRNLEEFQTWSWFSRVWVLPSA